MSESEEHPERTRILMDDCYEMARTHPDPRVRLEALRYYMDRREGKPTTHERVELEGLDSLGAGVMREIVRLVGRSKRETKLIEGEFHEIEEKNDAL